MNTSTKPKILQNKIVVRPRTRATTYMGTRSRHGKEMFIYIKKKFSSSRHSIILITALNYYKIPKPNKDFGIIMHAVTELQNPSISE